MLFDSVQFSQLNGNQTTASLSRRLLAAHPLPFTTKKPCEPQVQALQIAKANLAERQRCRAAIVLNPCSITRSDDDPNCRLTGDDYLTIPIFTAVPDVRVPPQIHDTCVPMHRGWGMNPWYGKAAVLVTLIAFMLIRAPHGRRSRTVRVVEDRKGGLEILLLMGAILGTTVFLLVWVTTGFPSWADYPLHPLPYALGLLAMLAGLWLFYRSHADLGTNWSITVQARENHSLVSTGIYLHVRHPMYASMFLLSLAHLLFVPNWIVSSVYLLSFGLLYLFRVGREERLMLDRFGSEYEAYMRRTGRLLPRLRPPAQR
jgi:protein-S-isoprenylcysteine O-methyltransferase Ste14